MAKNTIKLKNYSDVIEELKAAGTITPGMLVEIKTATTVGFHDASGGNALPMFALEDELQGKGIDDNYVVTDQVQLWVPYRGDIVNAILEDGEEVNAGDFLVSAGNGKLKKLVAVVFGESSTDTGTVYPLAIVGQATEDVDMSGSSGADPVGRIAVRIV